MKSNKIMQFDCISTADANEFAEILNRKMRELAPYGPTCETDISGAEFRALISWTETEKKPETVAEQFELEGIRYICRECPLHDITTDKRRKRVSCKYAEHGVTHLDHRCCEYFYKLLNQNKIQPVVEDPDVPGENTVTGTIY